MRRRLLDWRLWLSWTFAMLATAAVISLWALVGVVQHVQHKLDGRSTQSLCIARVQGDFDRHIAALVVASVDKDTTAVAAETDELKVVARRLDAISSECPNP